MWVNKPNTPRINKAFAGIRDVAFLGSNKIGPIGHNYEKVLSGKLNALGPPQLAVIDARLALGNYVIRTASAKQKRRALRAVLLACSVMLPAPKPAASYLQRYKSMGLDDLRHAFFSVFPYNDNSVVRAMWSPGVFTDPGLTAFAQQFAQAKDWNAGGLPAFRFMVHCVDDPANWGGKADPVAELSNYDLTSMTLLDSTKRFTYFNWGGMVFNVPQNNILITYAHDQMSNTHGGARGANGELALVNEIKTLAIGTDGLKSPDDIVAGQSQDGAYLPQGGGNSPTKSSSYNEISVCGRPGTPLPWGHSGALTLKAVFSLVPKNGVLQVNHVAKSKEWAAIGTALNVPMLYIPMM